MLRLVPDDGEVAGLLALMLLVDARRPARTGPDGTLVPLAEQDRTCWYCVVIVEGIALVTASLAGKPLGPYQLQAAIAAVHDEAPTADDTDWPQILALYRLLERMDPGPTVTLNRAVAEAMVHGRAVAGLDLLASLTVDDRVSGAHRFDAGRAHTSSRWPASTARRTRLTGGPPAGPRASPSAATFSPAPGALLRDGQDES